MMFFQWLREGVRQAVVLGLVDAIDDVGGRSANEDLGPALAQSLRDRLAVQREPLVLDPAATPSTGRKRLGRSLEGLRKAA